MRQAGDLFRLLGDEARLRLLRVLAGKHGRLNVTELTSVLGLAQSGVSRHLKLLKEAGLVAEERGGGFSFYRLSPALLDGGFGGASWPSGAACRTSPGSAAKSRSCRFPMPASTLRCCRRRCIMRPTRRTRRLRPRGFSGPAATCSCWICASTIRPGCAIAWAI